MHLKLLSREISFTPKGWENDLVDKSKKKNNRDLFH